MCLTDFCDHRNKVSCLLTWLCFTNTSFLISVSVAEVICLFDLILFVPVNNFSVMCKVEVVSNFQARNVFSKSL